MRVGIRWAAPICFMAFTAAAASAQDRVRIGVILPYSGQFADTAQQMDNGIGLYLKLRGDTVAGRKVQIVRKDTGGVAPDVAKRLAQELVVRDRVDILAGFALTPNALGAAGVSAEAGKFMVVMNAATPIIVTKSPYMVRTSFTLQQITTALGRWAATRGGIRSAYTMVSDFGPGLDAETGFQGAFRAAGGRIVGSLRMTIANPDFPAYVQRAKDLNPGSIFVFIPGGTQPAALGRAFAGRGIDPNRIKLLSTGEAVDETALSSLGDLALGRLSAWHYDYNHQTKLNRDFVAAYNAEFKRNPDHFVVGAFDGMHVIYEALKKAGGRADGESLIRAARGVRFESPRGPIEIHSDTRDIVQNVYIRQVRRVGGRLVNAVIDTVPPEELPSPPPAGVTPPPPPKVATQPLAPKPGPATPPPAAAAQPPSPVVSSAPPVAPLGPRVALVIGNAAYKVGPLQNPGNDATAVADSLKAQLGFDKVILGRDLRAEAFRSLLREFAREVAGAELALVYYAGHGTEVAGRNFLIPVDAALAKASDLDLEAIALDVVLSQLDGVRKLRIVILDACRNNIFPLAGGHRSVGRGLSRIEPEGDNTLVVYAAKHGTTADDGSGRRHSPFTEALLKRMGTRGLEVRQLFGYVRDDVMAATRRVQQPYIYGTLGGPPMYLRQ
jgi:branched-chain amino acid transport system substrate-binding protein